MLVISILFSIIVVLIVVFLIYAGINGEIQKNRKIETEKKKLFTQLMNDFKENKNIGEHKYRLPLGKIISNISIYYSNLDKEEYPNKEEWEQTIFSICFMCTQMRIPKDAKGFYDKFIAYKDYKFEHPTNPSSLKVEKIDLKLLLKDALFFERWNS